MTIPQSGAFQIVQKECSFIWIGCIVAEILNFMHLYLTTTEEAAGLGFQAQTSIYWCIWDLQI